jgi:hypothetical protein
VGEHSNIRRRILITVGGSVGLVLLILVTMPLWLGTAMRSMAPRFGVTFSDYIRVGYGRFALTDAAYRAPGVQATADRIEISSPVAWLWRRVAGHGADVRIGNGR